MTGPLHVAPPELVAYARRVSGLAGTAAGRTPTGALTTVAGVLPDSEVSAYASALAERMALAQRAIESDLDDTAGNTRTATDVIVHSDEANAGALGRLGTP